MRVELTHAGGSSSFQVYGGFGNCRTETNNLPEGTSVKVKACLKNGDTGRETNCAVGYGKA